MAWVASSGGGSGGSTEVVESVWGAAADIAAEGASGCSAGIFGAGGSACDGREAAIVRHNATLAAKGRNIAAWPNQKALFGWRLAARRRAVKMNFILIFRLTAVEKSSGPGPLPGVTPD